MTIARELDGDLVAARHGAGARHRLDRTFVLSFLLAFVGSVTMSAVPWIGIITAAPALLVAMPIDAIAATGAELPSDEAMLVGHATIALLWILALRALRGASRPAR